MSGVFEVTCDGRTAPWAKRQLSQFHTDFVLRGLGLEFVLGVSNLVVLL